MNSNSIIPIIIGLALTQSVFADGVSQSVDGLETDVATLESGVSTLEGQVATLQTDNAALEAVINTQAALIADLASVVDGLVEQQRCHTRPADLRADETGNYIGGVNWSGCDKTGLSMWGQYVGGSTLENLTNADLSFVNFTLANLIGIEAPGSNLEGARFVNVNMAYSQFQDAIVVTALDAQTYGLAETVFINTWCPDETYSEDNGGTCAGHMIPLGLQ